jgi:hypothetical protein
MQPKLFGLGLLLLLCVSFSSCQKIKDLFGEEEDPFECKNLVALKVTPTPNPVTSGSSFQLMLNETHTGSTYIWTGPNGFTSSDPEPTINVALSSHRGKYSVEEVTVYGCRIKATSDSVVVNLGTPACTPANNTSTIASAGTTTYSSGMHGGTTGGVYRFTANGSNGDAQFDFTSRPVAGTYTVTNDPSPDPGEVYVGFVAISSWWGASSGKAYVTVTNNKVKITFCSIPVGSTTWSTTSTASGQITEN